MTLLRCVVVDDNELDRLTICSYISSFKNIELLGVYEIPEEALKNINKINPDIVFLDIDMPGMSGLELRKQLLNIPVCIFTTDHPGYAIESFELETLDYLLKPYSLERFSKTIERIEDYIEIRTKAEKFEIQKHEEIVFVKDGYKKVKISVEEILCLTAMQNYTAIITKDSKHYVLSSLTSLLAEKKFKDFLRIHRSYAINKNHISILGTKEVVLDNGEKLPIGRSYKDNTKGL